MTYPVSGPGSALLDRLDRVPRDGRWRTTAELSELLDLDPSTGTLVRNLRMLALDGAIERRDQPHFRGRRFEWRRTP